MYMVNNSSVLLFYFLFFFSIYMYLIVTNQLKVLSPESIIKTSNNKKK